MDESGIDEQIKALCPLLETVEVRPGLFGAGSATIISNCKCRCNRGDINVPHEAWRRGVSIAEYAAVSLRNCTPGLVGMKCTHRNAVYVGRNGHGETLGPPIFKPCGAADAVITAARSGQ